MQTVQNEFISYDDHGRIPFDVPFEELQPSDISLYLQLNTKVGKSTCRQACVHCFYINQPEAADKEMNLVEGRLVMDDLLARGYQVFPMISDSLANGGEFLRLFGNTHNRDFREDLCRRPTRTMKRGDMWTSGAPLLDDDWQDLLCTGIEHGFGNVTITFHGILDENLRLLPHKEYPIQGTFGGADCEEVIRRIHAFNEDLVAGRIARLTDLSPDERQPILINMGVTIGKHNNTREHLLRYATYFNRLGVAVVRFNAFHDHGFRLPLLKNTDEEIARCFQDLKWIHTHVPLNFQLGLDEDFGTTGIEVMEFPEHTGWCRAGRQLFAIVPVSPVVVADSDDLLEERIGDMAGCVDAFKPLVGALLRRTDKRQKKVSYDVEFYTDVIAELLRKRRDGTYKNGCFAPEMLEEMRANGLITTAALRRPRRGVPSETGTTNT